MTVIANTEILRQYKSRFFLIVEQVLVFDSSHNMVKEVKNVFPNFKQIASRRFTLVNILIRIVRPILLLNSEQFH